MRALMTRSFNKPNSTNSFNDPRSFNHAIEVNIISCKVNTV